MCPLVFPSTEPGDDSLNLKSRRATDTCTRRSKSPISTPFHDASNYEKISDRAELIERIKAGENPTWIANRTSPKEKTADDENDRPMSALHSGVFTDEESNRPHVESPLQNFNFRSIFPPPVPAPPPPPPPPRAPPLSFEHNCNAATGSYPPRRSYRSPSLSSISNFVFKTPTSPLVHSSNPDVMEAEPTSPQTTKPIDIGFRAPQNTFSHISPSIGHSPSLPRHSAFAGLSYKRRSLTDAWTAAPSERKHSRRLSSGLGHNNSDLPYGSFVGSYEESILNGRMSTAPSKPLNFVAQIGVLGLGKCKPSLRCPTHLTVTFPAYFYSVGDYDSPSPYVGQIDLESVLAEKSGRKFPGYRIPQKGQLQIVIKNPNKTAVKLFLVPYDLRDMEPGTKTFVRQKSYALNNSVLTDALASSTRAYSKLHEKNRESLRYLIHLHICCPSRGRYYLHRNIRVVFANRVPDGKEKLRNELLLPDPKYSPWKPKMPESSSNLGSVGNGRRNSMIEIVSELERPTDSPGELVPPIPALPPQFANWSSSGSGAAVSAIGESYEKIDASIYSTTPRTEAQSLLARKLKSLEVDGFIDIDPRLAPNGRESLCNAEELFPN